MTRVALLAAVAAVMFPAGAQATPLHASGRSLLDTSNTVVCSPSVPCKGFNLHAIADWPQSTFDDMAAVGARVGRVIARWDDFEPTANSVPSAKALAMDHTISRMRTAGLYAIIDFHLIGGGYPSWTGGQAAGEQKYKAYGRYLTQWFAKRYGRTSSSHYASNVIGMGLNEIPVDDGAVRNGPGNVTYVEGIQRQMVSWMRTYASKWIGFVGYGYGAASPLPGNSVRADLVPADPHVYDSVGGNVVIDLHDYMLGDTRAASPYDGRQYNGMLYPVWQGGWEIGVGDEATYTSSPSRLAQQAQYHKPYKDFTVAANLPLMIGEWGWVSAEGGEAAMIADKKTRWADDGAAIQLNWAYNVTANTVEDPWAARPGGVWRPSVLTWMQP